MPRLGLFCWLKYMFSLSILIGLVCISVRISDSERQKSSRLDSEPWVLEPGLGGLDRIRIRIGLVSAVGLGFLIAGGVIPICIGTGNPRRVRGNRSL